MSAGCGVFILKEQKNPKTKQCYILNTTYFSKFRKLNYFIISLRTFSQVRKHKGRGGVKGSSARKEGSRHHQSHACRHSCIDAKGKTMCSYLLMTDIGKDSHPKAPFFPQFWSSDEKENNREVVYIVVLDQNSWHFYLLEIEAYEVCELLSPTAFNYHSRYVSLVFCLKISKEIINLIKSSRTVQFK